MVLKHLKFRELQTKKIIENYLQALKRRLTAIHNDHTSTKPIINGCINL